ncbi:hypothetical protein QE429_000252 [Bacillus sp. SORGH_AS 510]|uniref:phage/plasmid replication domain-containing protein n=1 Tax=Bacillus sp. SORGH_AS_0510 TaxID=3041771 RepID=UPI0027896E81|nr:phage/plasmid replication protein [Bacillus sp. SORGH_AS_0510]MDQ1143425.1 hypothetical protein [Bacillus sp. SORGH_AS_0510]
MFDTVTLIAFDIEINPNQLEGIIPFTFMDNDDGTFISRFSFTKERISYKYNLQKRILKIELSIPKLIFGTNTKMVTESDIEDFWSKLDMLIRKHLNTKISKEQWIVMRLDISHNFKVDDVRAYISEINKKAISKRTKVTYNDNETVIFRNKSSSICFYDKEKECINKKEPQNVIENAKGILRLEIRPATYHLKEHSPRRIAVELISKDFFTYIIEKFNINDLLKQHKETEDRNLFKGLNVMKVADIEKVLAFKMLVEKIGEKTLLEKGYYKEGTFRNRKELLEEYNKYIRNGTEETELYISLD